jgi:UDPglucose 6-dehydrogenase
MAVGQPEMRIAVIGLWHLGSVTAACLASHGLDVVAFDGDSETVMKVSRGEALIYEPRLNECLKHALDQGKLRVTTDAREAITGADVIWLTWDTPVNADNRADVDRVIHDAKAILRFAADGQLVLVSSQVPVGTTAQLEQACVQARVTFGYVPENLRLGMAIESFTKPARVVVGLRNEADRERVTCLLAPFTDRIEWMSVESAEMTKHALNAFLATSVAFANEIARLCEVVGADAAEVARGMKTDPRIGTQAYLSPGSAFAGGTLARDVAFLAGQAARMGETLDLIQSVTTSNTRHQLWASRRLAMLLGTLAGRTIAIWGLTYKPDTDTLRGSPALPLIAFLAAEGSIVRVYDPAAEGLPDDISRTCTRCSSAIDAAAGADAVVVSTTWPEFQDVEADDLVRVMKTPRVLDANRFLTKKIGRHEAIRYITVGTTA